MTYIYYYYSPLGGITVSSNGSEITGLWFDGQKYFGDTLPKEYAQGRAFLHPQQADGLRLIRDGERGLPIFEAAKKWLDIYFSGKEPDFMPPIHMIGSPFRLSVWELLRQIPYGKTVTYGELAKKVAGQRGLSRMSAQAVGGAVGHNEISIIVPCHRVVGSDGSLTGYAGGLDKKEWLLALEGVDMETLSVGL